MIDFSQRMIDVQSKVSGEPKDGWGLNPIMKKHLELEIKTLKNAPRDASKLRRLLDIKQRQKEEAMHIEDTQRLVTETEMLNVVLYLVFPYQSTIQRIHSRQRLQKVLFLF